MKTKTKSPYPIIKDADLINVGVGDKCAYAIQVTPDPCLPWKASVGEIKKSKNSDGKISLDVQNKCRVWIGPGTGPPDHKLFKEMTSRLGGWLSEDSKKKAAGTLREHVNHVLSMFEYFYTIIISSTGDQQHGDELIHTHTYTHTRHTYTRVCSSITPSTVILIHTTKHILTGVDMGTGAWATSTNIDAYLNHFVASRAELAPRKLVDALNSMFSAFNHYRAWEARHFRLSNSERIRTESMRHSLDLATSKAKAERTTIVNDKARMGALEAESWPEEDRAKVYNTICDPDLRRNAEAYLARARTLAQVACQYTNYQRGQVVRDILLTCLGITGAKNIQGTHTHTHTHRERHTHTHTHTETHSHIHTFTHSHTHTHTHTHIHTHTHTQTHTHIHAHMYTQAWSPSQPWNSSSSCN